MNPETTPESQHKTIELQPISEDMRDEEQKRQYQQPPIAPSPGSSTPPSLQTPNPLDNLSDKEIDEITRKASRPETQGILIVITWYIAAWLLVSNGLSLYRNVAFTASFATSSSLTITNGIMTPLSIALSIIGILAGLGLIFFRNIARWAVIIYTGLSVLFMLYTLFALGSSGIGSVLSLSFAYYAVTLLFVPVNIILFLTYKPTKRLFH